MLHITNLLIQQLFTGHLHGLDHDGQKVIFKSEKHDFKEIENEHATNLIQHSNDWDKE